MKTALALLVAVAGSVLINAAIFLQKRAVLSLPQVRARLSWDLIKAFITNRLWLLAQAANVSGFTLYMAALSFAPVSVVEPIIASGVVIPAWLAMRHLGEKPRRLDFLGMGMSVLGVIFIALSLMEGLPEDVLEHPLEIWFIAAAVFGLATAIPLLMRGRPQREAAGLGVSVGLLFGIAAVFSRLTLLYFNDDWLLFTLFAVACVAGYLPGFIVLQAALQRGMTAVVAPIYNGIMELVPIVLGLLVLNERLPGSFPLAALRLAAFVMIIVGAVILSTRAEAS